MIVTITNEVSDSERSETCKGWSAWQNLLCCKL